MKLLILFLALMFAWMQPAQAAWQDAEALAVAQSELIEWEVRFVKAVANPEIQLVRVDKVNTSTALSSDTINPVVIEDATISPPKYNRNPKLGEPIFKRVRNFVRYLAKVQYSHQQLQAAQEKYEATLKALQTTDKNFQDLDYKKNTGLDGAESTWRNIVKEVGDSAVREASAAYAMEEVVLKSLTD